MPLNIVEKDILETGAEAIVNSTNHHMEDRSGVGRLLHSLGGPAFEEECARLKDECVPGEAVYTGGHDLPCRYVIHTIGPVWRTGHRGEPAVMRSCYRSSLQLAEALGCRSVAFPLISAGSHGAPLDVALGCAVSAISEFLTLTGDEMDVTLTLHGEVARLVKSRTIAGLDEYLAEKLPGRQQENAAAIHSKKVCGNARPEKESFRAEDTGTPYTEEYACAPEIMPCMAPQEKPTEEQLRKEAMDRIRESRRQEKEAAEKKNSLEEILDGKEKSFTEMLWDLMEQKHMTAPQVYQGAYISRKTFNKLMNGGSKRPSLKTAVALSMALKLTIGECERLLATAGLALSPSSTFDLIARYFIEQGNYNIMELDLQLFKYNCKEFLAS